MWGHPLTPLQRQFRGTFHKAPQDQALVLCCFQLDASLIGFPAICFISPSLLFPGITSPVNYWTQAFVLGHAFRRTRTKAKTSSKKTLAGRKMTFKKFCYIFYLVNAYIKSFFLIYLFLAVLGLCCSVRAFSSCCEWRLLFVAARGLLIVVASLAVEHRV